MRVANSQKKGGKSIKELWMRVFYVILFGAIFSLFANAPSFLSNDKEIVLYQDQCSFDITFPSNAGSTGYDWSVVDINSSIFQDPTFQTIPSQKGLTGGSGQKIFYFYIKEEFCNAKNIKPSLLRFELKRSWEKSPIETKEFPVIFNYIGKEAG